MNQYIFTIYDTKAEAYTAPFVAKTAGIASRMFEELVNQQGHQFNKFPGDYVLYQVGSWDESNGVCTPMEPTNLGAGLQYLATGPELAREA